MNTFRFFVLSITLTMLAGCAEPPLPRLFWPPPPGEVALEFINYYVSQNDFEKTSLQRFFESIAGPPEPELFQRPVGIVTDGQGLVYIADNVLNNVRIFDFNKKELRMLMKEPIFSFPIGLDIDRSGRIYVADAGLKKVLLLDKNGVLLQAYGDAGLLENPAYVKVNERLGRLYVTDGKKHQVVVFALDGKYLFSFGSPGTQAGQLFSPQGIAIAADNRVFVASQFSAKVVVYDADGKHLYSFGERGDIAGLMEMPKALAFDSLGQLYVADTRKGSVTIMSDKGVPQMFIGGGQNRWQPTTFGMPNSIFIDDNDRIYVVDALTKRFVVWQYLSEKYLKEHPISEEDLDRAQRILRKPVPESTSNATQ